MKTRFNTYDIVCMVTELQGLVGMRVNQVYDIDNKTYVIRLQRSEEKVVLLLESGNRFHTTQFEWPKNVAPSGFTMKLRKHLKNKRLEKLSQLGIDRIVDLQFGSGEVAFHVILELYDRGNIVLTDHELTIMNVLRPHVEGDKIRFAVKEKYPLDRAKTTSEPPDSEALQKILLNGKPADNLKKLLNPHLEYGAALIDHVLLENGLAGNMKVNDKGFMVERDLAKLVAALAQAEGLLQAAKNEVAKGYIIQKRESRPSPEGESFLLTNQEFHPMALAQHAGQPRAEFETFDRAVDEFYSAFEGQKIDLKTIQVEREALKKLQNVRKDHDKRLGELARHQLHDRLKAELIVRNQVMVDQARSAVQSAIANQMTWDDIKLLVKTAQEDDDPIAGNIKHLKLNTNHITLYLTDPYSVKDSDEDDEVNEMYEGEEKLEPMLVDIDLALTAYANSRKYYDLKRFAAKKEQKTIESSDKALKSAERKTKQTLKEANTISNITKARKTYWFEKFYWFISSENYLVIGGRDQQQNELLVKRYMRPTDIYVHAEVSGAASVIVKNPAGGPVPPRTLSEAGQAAVAYSVAWEAKVLTRAWWVHAHQVSKSAPTGEYLTTGSFMIRGRKTYLLPEHMQFGFTFMFRLEDSCIERHRGERKTAESEDASDVTSVQDQEDLEIVVSDEGEDDQSDKEDDKTEPKTESLEMISEETTIEIKGDEQEKGTEDAQDGETDKDEKGEEDSESETDESSSWSMLDTHIKIDHGTGAVVMQSKARTISEMSDKSGEEKPLTFPELPKKGGKKPAQRGQKEEPKEKSKDGPKRGQKGKLKKIKEKYKDQDDEDKALMMQLLQSSNNAKTSKKAQKKALAARGVAPKKAKGAPKIPAPAPLLLEAESEEEVEVEVEPEVTGSSADSELLWQLTGCPAPEDELLFAVPVVAPYTALNNYKYKVKLTPGTSKRGKAAKTAIQVFLRDKVCSQREKDLLKAVKEENVARNFPGKVKLSAPQLHKHKK